MNESGIFQRGGGTATEPHAVILDRYLDLSETHLSRIARIGIESNSPSFSPTAYLLLLFSSFPSRRTTKERKQEKNAASGPYHRSSIFQIRLIDVHTSYGAHLSCLTLPPCR